MIPVSVISGLRFTQEHPFVTGVVIAVLLALATLAASRSPQRKKALRAVSVALVIGAIGFYSWAYNTRTPGLADQVAKLAKHAAAEQAAKSDTVEAK